MEYTQIGFEVDAGIATITLSREASMNSMSSQMLMELSDAFRAVNSRDDIAVVIITGSGDRAFCAGLDLKELSEGTDKFFEKICITEITSAMQSCGCPVIGAINGCAITGGFELALACDFLVASDNAKFADTHARVGLVPAWGMTQKLPRLIGVSRAKELSLTGRFISPQEALSWGLVNHVVSPQELLPKAYSLAESMLSADSRALTKIKDLIDHGWRIDLQSGLEYELEEFKKYTTSLAVDTVARTRSAVQEQGRKAQDC
ncbi:MAG: enoyl-CoA hydratase [Pseudomonadota bacterium]|nr:enoyl-CoA hydratase [Pseudomonadota bacterium]